MSSYDEWFAKANGRPEARCRALGSASMRELLEVPTMSAGQERAQNGDGEKALDGRDELEASSYKIIDAIPTIAWCARPDGFNEFLNRRWCDYTGLPPEEGLGWKWKEAIHPEDLGKLIANWETLLANGGPGDSEARMRRSDGAYRWFLIRYNPFRNEQGRIVRWYVTGTDIDDLKRAEAKLRQDEDELRRTTDLIPQTIIVLNTEGKAIYANRVALEYTGLSLDEMQADDSRERIFHPEDIQRLRGERREALLGNVPFENEQRARGKDGTYRWFLIRYNPFFDDNGNVIRWYATGTDIEDRKRAEEKLRHEERELRQLIDSIPQHVVVLDANGSLVQANQVLLDYYGRTLEEMRGAEASERFKRDLHPDDLQRVPAERDRGLSMGTPFEMEKRLLGKDGRYRWFLFRYNPLRDEGGQIERWFATATDIEDRKQAEERIRNETVALREEIVRSSMFEEIVGSSDKLRKVLEQVARVAPTDSTVLIQGETGTGKELIARAIHNRSKRANRAFIRVNCAAIPTSLIAAELFGHEKGAFTGALQRRAGRFESADGGTIFLDEIGELPPETQVALLRVLQEREFERVGGNRSIPVDVRVLAATNRDLNAVVAKGTFRQDLFYRLNVFPIQLPPLRDRVDDIPLLVEYMVGRYGEKARKRIRRISRDTLDLFQSYDWPGNIRELQNVIERAVILCDEETFSVDETWLQRKSNQPPRPVVSPAGILAKDKEEFAFRERKAIEAALTECQGRVSGPRGAAAKLGIPHQTLESKIRSLGIDKRRFKVRSSKQGVA